MNTSDASTADIETPAPRPMKILVATDGSPCSDRAVQSVAMRPWPTDSLIEIVSVVYTRIPSLPDPQLMIEAAHTEALEADRQRALGACSVRSDVWPVRPGGALRNPPAREPRGRDPRHGRGG